MAAYMRAVWSGWVTRLSGPASVLLVVLGFSLPLADNGRSAFWVAAGLCFVLTSFSVWSAEHSRRLKLEVESGPQLIVEFAAGGRNKLLRFRNVSQETAHNVALDFDRGNTKLCQFPPVVPSVFPGQHEDVRFEFFAKPTPTVGRSVLLEELLEKSPDRSIRVNVQFENSVGTRYEREFEIKAEMNSGLDIEYLCYAKQRRIVSP